MKKKILALFLCCVMVIGLLPATLAFAAETELKVDADTVSLKTTETKTLTADAGELTGRYQWQIHDTGNDIWVNILGANGKTLTLTYGLVANLLSGGAARIRCRMTTDGKTLDSNVVKVEIQPDAAVAKAPARATAMSPAIGTVTSEAKALGDPIIIPAQTAAPAADQTPADDTVQAADQPQADDTVEGDESAQPEATPQDNGTGDTPATPTTYSIIINYVFQDNSQAANPWTATVAAGSSYSQEIESPVVVGYEPDQKTVKVDVTDINENKTYTVIYKPTTVNFIVKHYQQNVTNDDYTLVDTETKTGYTESAVGGSLAKTDYTGFYSLLYDTTTKIAADGSTEVEIKYDRYYYLMNFNLDGGYGVEPIYARYGAAINVGTPTKPGYTFGGWDNALPTTMPAKNTTFTSKWNKCGDTAFTVAFYYENADDNGYTFMDSKVYHGTTGDRVSGSAYKDESFSGKDTKHFTYLDSKTDKNVEIKGDGSTVVKVYFSRNVYTMEFYGISCGRDGWLFHSHSKDDCCKKVTARFSAKYNANIAQQYARITKNHRWSRWDADACTALVSYMPDNSNPNALKYWQKSDGSTVYNITYAYESENGTIKHDGKKFTALATSKVPMSYVGYSDDYLPAVRNGYSVYTDYSKAASPKFEANGQIKKPTTVTLFYYANTYTLRFMNAETKLKTTRVKYDFSIKGNSAYMPDGSFAPNGMVFDCWCLDPAGAQPVDWSTQKMPAGDLVLYARWKPRIHTVKTYLTKVEMDEGKAPTNTWPAVPHGTAVTDPPTDPERDPYKFVGWFYISDTGEEKAFDFKMPVNRDLNLYAKWNADALVEYTINYQLEDGTEIAPPTKGSALAGSTKTFNAKTGTELNTGYQSGYFPKVSSHSLTIDIDGGNEYTFIYVPKAKVKYTVRYLEKGTGRKLVTPWTTETSDAVVTQTFVALKGYAPDAYQKQLVLSADAEKNEIIFWYVKDTIHAPVQTIHWIQNIQGEGYTEYQSSTDVNAEIGKRYSGTALEIPGFRYAKGSVVAGTKTTEEVTAPATPSGTLTAYGLVLNLYYDRIEYPYEFRFLEQGTDKELADADTGSARYGARVTRQAKDIPGYTLVSSENQYIDIAIEEPANVANKNVRTFYYTEQTVEIKYEVAGPDGCGTLDNYQESQLKAMTGTPKGSTPTANPGFKFAGWYLDENCVMDVDGKIPNAVEPATNKLTPQKRKTDGCHYEWTYYAKFEYDVADLTIHKLGCETIDENQSFIFTVTGGDLPASGMNVVIKGNDHVTIKGLKIAEYTVTEVTNWSWRYTPKNGSQKITLSATADNNVTFTNERVKDKWLGGDAYNQNKFGNSN